MSVYPVLIGGEWVSSVGSKTFQAINPATGESLPGEYPVSPWSEIERAIQAASAAAKEMHGWSGERFAAFLERYAARIEARKADLVAQAHLETALPAEGRLGNTELPRTINSVSIRVSTVFRASSDSSPRLPSNSLFTRTVLNGGCAWEAA